MPLYAPDDIATRNRPDQATSPLPAAGLSDDALRMAVLMLRGVGRHISYDPATTALSVRAAVSIIELQQAGFVTRIADHHRPAQIIIYQGTEAARSLPAEMTRRGLDPFSAEGKWPIFVDISDVCLLQLSDDTDS